MFSTTKQHKQKQADNDIAEWSNSNKPNPSGLQCDGGGRVSLLFTVWTGAEVSFNATHLS